MTRLLLCLFVVLNAIGERAIAAELEPDIVFVPMRDGVELYTEVYLPNAPGPFPTLILRTPY